MSIDKLENLPWDSLRLSEPSCRAVYGDNSVKILVGETKIASLECLPWPEWFLYTNDAHHGHVREASIRMAFRMKDEVMEFIGNYTYAKFDQIPAAGACKWYADAIGDPYCSCPSSGNHRLDTMSQERRDLYASLVAGYDWAKENGLV